MRYVFIINPTAGKKDVSADFMRQAEQYFALHPAPYRCVVTQYAGHAAVLAGQEAACGDAVRIYGVGGDGTLLEIAQGARGCENAEIGIFPYGSGNDYIRTFHENKAAFLSLENQLTAPSRRVDMICADGKYALNICSLGVDAEIAAQMTKYKGLPFISGSMAYNLACVKCLVSKIGVRLRARIDDVKELNGEFMFALAASGQYYGGGYQGAPKAVPDDGLLDFVLIRKPRLYRIPVLLSKYKRGQHLTDPAFCGLLEYCRGKKMELFPEKTSVCNCDGECSPVQKVEFKIERAALRFIVAQ